MKHVRATIIVLRLLAALQILTASLALIPTASLAKVHAWVGLGPLPESPFLQYVVRGGAFVQGCIGVLIWVMATDVLRYRPLIIATGAIYLACAPVFLLIHLAVKMPAVWCAADTGSCLLTGLVVLTLALKLPAGSSERLSASA